MLQHEIHGAERPTKEGEAAIHTGLQLDTPKKGMTLKLSCQSRKRRTRPKNEKRKEKDRERLMERIRQQKLTASDAISPESEQSHGDQSIPLSPSTLGENASLQIRPYDANHLGLPLYLRPSGPTPDLQEPDFVPKRLSTRTETWNYFHLEDPHASPFEYKVPPPSMTERTLIMVPKRKTVPQDELTTRHYMRTTPEDAMVERDTSSPSEITNEATVLVLDSLGLG